MPIVDVEIVTDEDPRRGLAQTLADRLGGALEAPEGSTWVRLRVLPRNRYAESGGPVAPDIEPVFVTITAHHRPEPDRLAQIVDDVASAVAGATGHPQRNVHVLFEPDAAGRIAFGGRLVQ